LPPQQAQQHARQQQQVRMIMTRMLANPYFLVKPKREQPLKKEM
jgi:hypothetical protein